MQSGLLAVPQLHRTGFTAKEVHEEPRRILLATWLHGLVLNSLSYKFKPTCMGNGITHNGLSPPTSIIRIVPLFTYMPIGNHDMDSPSTETLLNDIRLGQADC